MKTSKRGHLLIALILPFLVSTSVMAVPDRVPDRPNPKAADIARDRVLPEIDASAGTSGIALLVGLLLLVKERPRRKRS